MNDKNGGYVIIDLEATKECYDKIKKYFDIKPILLNWNGKTIKLDDMLENDVTNQYGLILYTSIGKMSLFVGKSSTYLTPEYTYIGKTATYGDVSVLTKIDFTNPAKALGTYTMTDEESGEFFNILGGATEGTLKDFKTNAGIEGVLSIEPATYTDGSSNVYEGALVNGRYHKFFIGSNFLVAGYELLIGVIDITDVTPE